MEESRRVDRRVIRTKRSIRNAFIKLMASKDINEITVKDIADAADVDRKTIYNYYRGVYEIRDEVENELLALLENAIDELDFKANFKNPIKLFEILASIINSNIELYGQLFKIDTDSYIIKKINVMLRDRVCDGLKTLSLENCDCELCADYIMGGILAVFQSWFNAGCVKPIADLSRDVGMLIINGLRSFTENDKELAGD